MKHIFYLLIGLFLLAACGNGGQNKAAHNDSTLMESKASQDTSMVYVYYFHGKQRCMTCNTVEKVAKEAVETNYATNSKVQFMALPTDDKVNESLVEQYEISWNGLIIAKGNKSVNITEQAFANAVDNPKILEDLIKKEINSRL